MKTAMSEDPAVRARAYKAAVRLAGNMAKMGKKDEATGLCRMIASGNAPDAQKAAAQMMIEKLK